jgi:putative transposase
MPWKDLGPMEQRLEFLKHVLAMHEAFARTCRRYDISRKTGYKWLQRYHEGGQQGLNDRSRAPKHHPQSIDEELAKTLVEMRQRHCDWGPITVVNALRRKGYKDLPAPSTVGDLFKRRGLVRPRVRRPRRPAEAPPVADFAAPNRCWCIDFKGQFQMNNRQWCYPLTVTDGCSRFLLCCDGKNSTDMAGAKKSMERCFAEFGLPDAILSDNGVPFSSAGAGGLSQLSVWWVKLGIRPMRIMRGKPQQNGRHERMHGTLQRKVGDNPADSMPNQQRALDAFRLEYNNERPHRALDGKTPSDVYEPSEKPFPATLEPPAYPGHHELRSVRTDGSIKWRGRHLFLGDAFHGELVGLKEFADDRWLIRFGPIDLAVLDDRGPEPEIRRLPHPASLGAQDCPG